MTTTTNREELTREADALSRVEYLVETNEGTYSAVEAQRATGTGDPRYNDRNVYETVGGSKRVTGPSDEDAPGRMRQLNRTALSADRTRLADLRKQIAAL